jgi:DNA mismatch endonuclease (patch repair protein)
VDIWSKEKRSEVMSKIRGKNTKPELLLRSQLFKQGFRFRIHRKNLPGKPDVVLPKYKTVIFVHGCFWHYHKDCKEGRIPSTNSTFWKNKLQGNVAKDKANVKELEKMGWQVITIWECEIERNLMNVVKRLNLKKRSAITVD